MGTTESMSTPRCQAQQHRSLFRVWLERICRESSSDAGSGGHDVWACCCGYSGNGSTVVLRGAHCSRTDMLIYTALGICTCLPVVPAIKNHGDVLVLLRVGGVASVTVVPQPRSSGQYELIPRTVCFYNPMCTPKYVVCIVAL